MFSKEAEILPGSTTNRERSRKKTLFSAKGLLAELQPDSWGATKKESNSPSFSMMDNNKDNATTITSKSTATNGSRSKKSKNSMAKTKNGDRVNQDERGDRDHKDDDDKKKRIVDRRSSNSNNIRHQARSTRRDQGETHRHRRHGSQQKQQRRQHDSTDSASDRERHHEHVDRNNAAASSRRAKNGGNTTITTKPRRKAENLEDFHPSDIVHHGILSPSSSSSSSSRSSSSSSSSSSFDDDDDVSDLLNQVSDVSEDVGMMGCMDGLFMPGRQKTARQAFMQLNANGEKELKFNMKIPIALGFKNFAQQEEQKKAKMKKDRSRKSTKKSRVKSKNSGAVSNAFEAMSCGDNSSRVLQQKNDRSMSRSTGSAARQTHENTRALRLDPPGSTDSADHQVKNHHQGGAPNEQVVKSLMSLSDTSSADEDGESTSTTRPENFILPPPVPSMAQQLHMAHMQTMHGPANMYPGPWAHQQHVYGPGPSPVQYSAYEVLVQGIAPPAGIPMYGYGYGPTPYWNNIPMSRNGHHHQTYASGAGPYIGPPSVERMPSQIVVEEKLGSGDDASVLSYEVVQHIGDLHHRSSYYAQGRMGPFPRGPTAYYPHVSNQRGQTQVIRHHQHSNRFDSSSRSSLEIQQLPDPTNRDHSDAASHKRSDTPQDDHDVRHAYGRSNSYSSKEGVVRSPIDPVGSISSLRVEESSQASFDGFEDAQENEQSTGNETHKEEEEDISRAADVPDSGASSSANMSPLDARASRLNRLKQQNPLRQLEDGPSNSVQLQNRQNTAEMCDNTPHEEIKDPDGPSFDEGPKESSTESVDSSKKNDDQSESVRAHEEAIAEIVAEFSDSASLTSDQAIVESKEKEVSKVEDVKTTMTDETDQSTDKCHPEELGDQLLFPDNGIPSFEPSLDCGDVKVAKSSSPEVNVQQCTEQKVVKSPKISQSNKSLKILPDKDCHLTLLPPQGVSVSVSQSIDESDEKLTTEEKEVIAEETNLVDISKALLSNTVKSADTPIGQDTGALRTDDSKSKMLPPSYPAQTNPGRSQRGRELMFDSIHFRREERKRLGLGSYSSDSLSSGRPSMDASEEGGDTSNPLTRPVTLAPTINTQLNAKIQRPVTAYQLDRELEEWGNSLLEKHAVHLNKNHQKQSVENRDKSPLQRANSWKIGEQLSPILGPPDEIFGAIVQTASTSSTDAVLQADLAVPALGSPAKNSKLTSLKMASPRMNPLAPSPRNNVLSMSNNDDNTSTMNMSKITKTFSSLPAVRSSMTNEWHDTIQSPNNANTTLHRSGTVSQFFSEDNDENDEFFDCD